MMQKSQQQSHNEEYETKWFRNKHCPTNGIIDMTKMPVTGRTDDAELSQ